MEYPHSFSINPQPVSENSTLFVKNSIFLYRFGLYFCRHIVNFCLISIFFINLKIVHADAANLRGMFILIMKILFALSFLFPAVSLFSQHMLTRQHNAPRPGDEIIKQQVEYKDPGRNGNQVLWDFSRLNAVNETYSLTYSEPFLLDSIYLLGNDTVFAHTLGNDALIVGQEHFTRYYYRIQDNGIRQLSHRNPVSYMRYTPLVPVVPFGLAPGEKQETAYRAGTVYSGTERMYVEGEITAEADAYGMMVLPDKDTLRHVVRIRSLHVLHENADSLANKYSEMPDSLRAEFERPAVKTITETFRWYEKGYRYPVFETIRTIDNSTGDENEYFTTAFFYPPQEHYYLDDDAENLAVLDSLANIPEIDTRTWIEKNFSYNVYPNPVSTDLYIEYHLEESADVKVTLYNSMSLPMKSIPVKQRSAGAYTEILNCIDLPQGSYVLRFDVKGEFVSEVILKK